MMLARRLLSFVVVALLIAGPFAFSANAADYRSISSITDNLIAYWKLDEASGTRVDELNGCGGSGCDLTDNNTVTSNTGVINSAGQFVAANSEYLSRADHADVSTGNVDWTIAAWFYADTLPTSGQRGIVTKWLGNAGNREYQIVQAFIGAGNVRVQLQVRNSADTGGSTIVANNAGALSAGNWYFIVAGHDAANDQLFIQVNNGTPDTSSYADGVLDGGAALNIGAQSGTIFHDGRVDEVGFWKRVLTADERTCLYNGGAGQAYPFTACDPTPTPTTTQTPTVTLTPTTGPSATPTDTPTPGPTNTSTSTPTATNTPLPTSTPTLPIQTCYVLDEGYEACTIRTATWGELAIFLAVLAFAALFGLRWLYELADKGG